MTKSWFDAAHHNRHHLFSVSPTPKARASHVSWDHVNVHVHYFIAGADTRQRTISRQTGIADRSNFVFAMGKVVTWNRNYRNP